MNRWAGKVTSLGVARPIGRALIPAAAGLSLALAACGTVVSGPATPAAPLVTPAMAVASVGVSTDETLSVNGLERRYRLHLPPAAAGGEALPLILNFHGYSGTGAMHENYTRMSDLADEAGFIAAYPEGTGQPQGWDEAGPEDVDFARALILEISARYAVDSDRIYATGFSNGAGLTRRLGCELADGLAAIAPVAGRYPADEDCRPARAVPTILFHGTADSVLLYEGSPPAQLPVRDWALRQAERNGCIAEPRVFLDSPGVTAEEWTGCAGRADVVFYTYRGLGHTWPGTAASGVTVGLSATRLMWEFFRAHPIRVAG